MGGVVCDVGSTLQDLRLRESITDSPVQRYRQYPHSDVCVALSIRLEEYAWSMEGEIGAVLARKILSFLTFGTIWSPGKHT
jgi:hypothetical protein